MYQIEVLTTSESREEITVVRLSPKAVEQNLRETLRNNFKVSNTQGCSLIFDHWLLLWGIDFENVVYLDFKLQPCLTEKQRGQSFLNRLYLYDVLLHANITSSWNATSLNS